MTQWIFRRYQCKCDSASSTIDVDEIAEPESPRRSPVKKSSKVSEQEEDFSGLELPFPVERYKPLRHIARSSLSVVYKCFDRQLGRLVAIKALSFPDSAMLVRFQQEARATGLLKHPNIVEVLDFGIGTGGAAYMVLEFVEATNLEDLLHSQGSFDEEETTSVIAGVCRALDFAHKKGIFHRDLKPQNILINNKKQPKLIDFGLALSLGSDFNAMDTRGLSLVGTPSYMSPDQFLGLPYDARSEIYSLGCVLFACLTGSPPYSGDNALDLANNHARAPIPTLHEACPDRQFSKRMEETVHRCLEKNPELRYASIAELARDLQIDLHEGIDPSSEFHSDDSTSHSDYADADQLDSDNAISVSQGILSNNAVTAGVAATLLIVVFAGTISFALFSGQRNSIPAKEQRTPKTQEERTNILSMAHHLATKTGDQKIANFDQTMDSQVERYLVGDKSSSEYIALFREATKLQTRKNATIAELYKALGDYEEAIRLRTKHGPVKAPDQIMAQALVGIFGINLRLSQLEQLDKYEKDIIKYVPDNSNEAGTAHLHFRRTAVLYKKSQQLEKALHWFQSALAVWNKSHKKDGLQDETLELGIGSTYLTLEQYENARVWLERTRAHLEKLPPHKQYTIPTLIRLGVVYQYLKDFKKSNLRFQQAEKVAIKQNDAISAIYMGQLYYGWAGTLRMQGRLAEAENKAAKALEVERDVKSKQVISTLLGNIRKERQQKHR